MLRSRINRANLNTEGTEREVGVLLPEGLLSDWLYNHPLVVHHFANNLLYVKHIYGAIMQIMVYKKAQTSTSPPVETPNIAKRVCINEMCSYTGPSILDARNGCYLCPSCGAVLSGSCNVVPEFNKAPELDYRNISDHIHGVTKTVVNMQTRSETSFLDDLEDLNKFAKLTTEEWKSANSMMLKIPWSHGTPVRARLFAVLLEPRLQELDEQTFRTNIRTWKTNDEVDPTPKPPNDVRFKCTECGVPCFTTKEAKYHCKWSQGVKKRTRHR